MTSRGVESNAAADSINLLKAVDSDKKYAKTVPFFDHWAPCVCTWNIQGTEIRDYKGCAECSAFAESKFEALEQTKKRWAWFLEARKLDDERSTRLGTLGYLHWDIRAKVFHHVLDDFMKKVSLGKYSKTSGDICNEFWPYHVQSANDGLTGSFIYPCATSLSNFLLSIPLRSATIDTKLEFDHIFFSTTMFRFARPSALHQFLIKLSATQQSGLRSISIRIFACDKCLQEGMIKSKEAMSREHSNWRSACDQLPSSLTSVDFDVRVAWAPDWHLYDEPYDCRWRAIDEARRIDRIKCAKDLVEDLGCRIRRRAPQTKIAVHGWPDLYERVLNRNELEELQLRIQEINVGGSKESVKGTKGLESAEG